MSTIGLGLSKSRVCLGMIPFFTHLTHKFSTCLADHFFSALCSFFPLGQLNNHSFSRLPKQVPLMFSGHLGFF